MTNNVNEPIVRQARARAPLEAVYAYFVDREKMLQWMGVSADLDPQPGGRFRINVTGRDIAVGEYLEVVPNQRLVFTWGWEAPGHPLPPGSTTVEVTFTQQGEVTVARVEHRDVPKAEWMNTAYGWQHYLSRLGLVAVSRDPGPDSWAVPTP